MMVKRGDAKTGTVVEAASAKEASVCPHCGRILPAAASGEAGGGCSCGEEKAAAAEVVATDDKASSA